MKFTIKKVVDAASLADAIKKERNAEIVEIIKDDESSQTKLGYRT